ncbi:integral membrane PTH11-like protein [Penicillium argentinense]|uniref:Integral membrane PTH11-like protein n=1 Tax=Penicillium argentinense TaxID=1131581 RepID=A0A9W9KFV2_9EURO|nr:integral membrane PTH11-like protein [Penicillium argentinense]KAJ5103607.1 integral membrane PTH11-like protein [Penicillium argentinense]
MASSTTENPDFLAQSRVSEVLAGYITPIPLELLTTGLRIYVKLRPSSKDRWAFDDYLIVWATAMGIAVCVSGLVYGPPYGFGRHIEAVPTEDLKIFMMGDYIFSHFYNAAIVGTKLSVLALYHRIFVTRSFRLMVISTAVFIFLWFCAMEISLGLECRPIQVFWDASVKGKCNNLVALTYFTNIVNLVADIWIFILPLPVIYKLQISISRKIGLSFLFGVGLATCAISAARLSVVVSQGSPDFTWAGVPLGVLSAFEPLGGILCANLPVLYRYFAKAFKTIKSAGRSHHSQSGYDYSNQHERSTRSVTNKWFKLPNASTTSDDKYITTSVVRGPNIDDDTTELRPMDGNTIAIQRMFVQDVSTYQDVEAMNQEVVRAHSNKL